MPVKTQSAEPYRARLPKPQEDKGPPDLKRCAPMPENSAESALEREFAARWASLYPDLILEREWRFDEVRRYRLDFAHLESRVGLEIQGGIWQKGGHSSGRGITRDCKKNFCALTGGWIVFALTDAMSRDAVILEGIAGTIRKLWSEKS